MRRSLWNRTLSAIFAVWLALVMGDAGFAHHHCSMHDGPLPTVSGSGMHGPAHADGHASHGEHGTPASSGDHLCTCIGACSASSGAVALSEPTKLPAAVIICSAAAATDRSEIRPPSARAAFTLPFANGPPRRIA
jgi:hypothetical protein